MLRNLALVADGDPQIRIKAADVLSGYGFRVATSGASDQVLSFLRGFGANTCLMLIDVELPETGGVELAARAAKDWPWIWTVLMSSAPRDQVEVPPLANFIPKPWAREQIELVAREAAVMIW